jgi:hypothetical protein
MTSTNNKTSKTMKAVKVVKKTAYTTGTILIVIFKVTTGIL